jgi:hypothetical protein
MGEGATGCEEGVWERGVRKEKESGDNRYQGIWERGEEREKENGRRGGEGINRGPTGSRG